jgi:hypothetical protein
MSLGTLPRMKMPQQVEDSGLPNLFGLFSKEYR